MGNCARAVNRRSERHEVHLVSGNPQDGPGVPQVAARQHRASMWAAAQSVSFEELVRVDMLEGRVARVTMLHGGAGAGGEGEDLAVFSWGTRMGEHRLNPPLLSALNKALDAALANEAVACVVVTGEGRFFSNGMDLQWIAQHQSSADDLQHEAELLLARLLTLPVPTVAQINGHFCAAGAMLGLAFDVRVMSSERGLFFVPGIDLGLVYSPGMTSLMKAKTPVHMHSEMIVFGQKYSAKDLERERVVALACSLADLPSVALRHALQLTDKGRFGTAKYRATMQAIKQNTFKEAFDLLSQARAFKGMGFSDGAWDEHGRAKAAQVQGPSPKHTSRQPVQASL